MPTSTPLPPTAPSATLELIATSTFGLEAIVSRELQSLGYQSRTIQPGRMLFEGDESALCRANLWLRTADRVLLRLGNFEARDFGQLFDGAYALPWERWLPADANFPVSGRSIKSQLSSVPACQKIVKKAIVEKLKAAHRVQELPESGAKFSIEIALLEDQATLTIDSTGPGLHKRGYRALVGRAPLKETLAAAMILLSFWKPQRPLLDPFCGTGTIPIEAALIGRNMAPGLNRRFAAEAWPALSPRHWEAARQEARDLVRADLPERILGTDIDEDALRLARHHAEKAGVAADIHFQQRPFSQSTSKRHFGCIICNPPYGQRMGSGAEATAIYRAMPDVFRRLKTWSFYILTAYPDFEGLLQQKADRRRKLYNGRIQCTYYQYYGPKPGSGSLPLPSRERVEVRGEAELAPAARPQAQGATAGLSSSAAVGPAFGGLSAKDHQQAEIFRTRLQKRARHLRRWPTKFGITCYRLYERDIPEVPLVVDRYEDCLHLAEFERPHEHTPAEHGDWLDLMKRTAAEALDVPLANVFLKRRERQRGPAQYERLSTQSRTLVAAESGLRFEVNLSDYLDTGLFLDHRITRGMVREAAAGKRFLNLFAYTGAFSVYAAAGGAESTTSVDLSHTYLDWAGRNMELNGFCGPEHVRICDDAPGFLESRGRRPLFDLAVVDPPTFSNSKKLDEFWDIQRDHAALLARLLPLMTPGGVIFFSTNFRRFKLAEAELAGATIREISRQTVPPDFRNRRIHRCWRLVRAS
ncbi:MAG: bifunctional 23S rRNA (guanine(2069)-N(7))-methyltransferase RlmK/23S rRNA (guanine(2445)-N(2))-methyltransferase RlmL [Thermoguttaceae bacterium]